MKVVERKGERGLSTAMQRGLDEAQAEIYVVMDADLSHPSEAIQALVKVVEEAHPAGRRAKADMTGRKN